MLGHTKNLMKKIEIRMVVLRCGLVLATGILIVAALSGVKARSIHQISQEQQQTDADRNACLRRMVEAGTKVYQGDQAGRICDQRYPTRPERAKQDVLDAVHQTDVSTQNVIEPILLPDGTCKADALSYISLQAQAYDVDGQAKAQFIAQADEVMRRLRTVSCKAVRVSS